MSDFPPTAIAVEIDIEKKNGNWPKKFLTCYMRYLCYTDLLCKGGIGSIGT